MLDDMPDWPTNDITRSLGRGGRAPCVCVCVCERERERVRDPKRDPKRVCVTKKMTSGDTTRRYEAKPITIATPRLPRKTWTLADENVSVVPAARKRKMRTRKRCLCLEREGRVLTGIVRVGGQNGCGNVLHKMWGETKHRALPNKAWKDRTASCRFACMNRRCWSRQERGQSPEDVWVTLTTAPYPEKSRP